MPGPSIGTNLSGLADWGTSYPFVNQFLMTRDWFTQSATEWNSNQTHLLDLDENGWVRGFTKDGSPAPFQSVSTVWQTNGSVFRPGEYVLDWQGEGSVTISGAQVLATADGKLTFRLSSADTIGFNITATDPDGTGDYVRDMRLYHKDDADLIEAGMIFNPAFLERIEDFRTLRFMDWGATNNSTVSSVADMRAFDAARQTGEGGASLEMMVELANQTRADAWFCIPHLADDAYIRAFVAYVHDHLDQGLVARFELSNEVWNWSFAQAQHAQAAAVALWGADVEGGWMQWYGMRAADMAQIVSDVFGTQTGTRALNVFATQAGWMGLEDYALNAPDAVADGHVAPKDAPFHVYAIAPYFGGAVGTTENAGLVDQWIAMGENGFRAAIAYIRSGPGFDSLGNIDTWISYHARVAQGLDWQLEGYEGGQHVVDLQGLFGGQQDPEQTAFFMDLVRRPEFRSLYTEYLNIWKDNGGGLMAQFSDIGLPSRFGSWGIWDSAFSPETPRSLAVQAFRDGVDVWWSDARPADTFLDGDTRIDTAGSNLLRGSAFDDHLFGLGGADVAYGGGGQDLIHTGQGGDTGFGGRAQDTILGGTGADNLFGGKGSDSLYGGTHGDAVHGRAGDDRIIGARGNDTLFGGISDDSIFGGTGDDSILGGAGRDVLSGDGGADSFVFGAGDGAARITDFNVRQDNLVLETGLLNPGERLSNVVANHARVTDDGVLLAFDDGTHILLQGLATTAGLTGALLLS